jgi:hypothetical protein
MKSPTTDIGYDVLTSSFPTPTLVASKEVLFVVGGVETGFPEEKPIVTSIEYIDEMDIPNMPEYENIVFDGIVVDIPVCSNPDITPNLDPISLYR